MRLYHQQLVNAKAITQKALAHKYAVGHFNINNLEWTKTLLTAAQKTNTPIILGVSEGAIRYMGGYKTVANLVTGLLEDLKINVPVVLHLDHGQSLESAHKAIQAGFSSVMFDGSHLPFATNYAKTKELVAFAHAHEVSVEAETGTIGGEEDGVIAGGELAHPDEAKKLADLKIDILAAGFGNIHGPYPANWKGLNFETLTTIEEATGKPLVLHGGSGIPYDQVQRAIQLGISKVNVNTECQIVFCEAVADYFAHNKHQQDKGYDPRKILKPGSLAIEKQFIEMVKMFGSYDQA